VLVALLPRLPEGLVVRGDSPELTLVALTQGIAHAPGYPLWTRLAGAWLALSPGEPAVALSVMGVVLIALSTGILARLLADLGARPLAAAGLAAAWALLPPHWGSVLAPEVYALELLLWVGALTAAHRDRPGTAGLLAALATSHRPLGLVLVGALLVQGPRRRLLGGLLLGAALGGLAYLDLGLRAQDPDTAWVDAVLLDRPLGWLAGEGLPDNGLNINIVDNSPVFLLQSWGAQAALWVLGLAGLLAAPTPGARSLRPLALAAAALGLWALLWPVTDPQSAVLPLFLLAALGWARTVGRWRPTGPLALAGATAMALLNGGAAPDTPAARATLTHAASTLPPGTVVFVDDWTWRTALSLQDGDLIIIPEGSTGHCAPPEHWVPGARRWAPEQRTEHRLPDAVVVWGAQARACAEDAGWTVASESDQPWAWAQSAAVPPRPTDTGAVR
jgi:hypothetical protein